MKYKMKGKSKIKVTSSTKIAKNLANPWIKHVATQKKKFPKKYAGLKVGDVMKMAKKSYCPMKKKK